MHPNAQLWLKCRRTPGPLSPVQCNSVQSVLFSWMRPPPKVGILGKGVTLMQFLRVYMCTVSITNIRWLNFAANFYFATYCSLDCDVGKNKWLCEFVKSTERTKENVALIGWVNPWETIRGKSSNSNLTPKKSRKTGLYRYQSLGAPWRKKTFHAHPWWRIKENRIKGFAKFCICWNRYSQFFYLPTELGERLQNDVASRTCASFSNGVASRAIAYFSTTKIRVISLSRHCVSRQ